MKLIVNILSALVLSSVLSGCFAYCDICAHELPADSGEVVGTVICENTQYKLFFCLPISAGVPWTHGPYEKWEHDIEFFSTHNLLNDNMRMVRLAERELGGTRVSEIRTEAESKSAWSLFLIEREVLRTSAVIAK